MREFPEIVVGSREGCRRYRLVEATGAWKPVGDWAPGPGAAMAVVPDGVLVAGPDRLRVLDRDLTVRADHRVEGLASFAVSEDGAVLVGGEGVVIAFDPKLSELGRVAMPTGMPKALHDIVWRGGRAWVLDNIMYPVYVFVLDVADLSRMRVVATGEIEDVYPHLEHQWVNEEDGRWFVVQFSSHAGGSFQTLHVLSAETAERAGRQKLLWARRSEYMMTEPYDEPDTPAPGLITPGDQQPVRLRFPEEIRHRSFGIRVCGVGHAVPPVAAVRDVTGAAVVGELIYRWRLPEMGRRIRSAAPARFSRASLAVAGDLVACLWTESSGFEELASLRDPEPGGAWLTLARRGLPAWDTIYDGPGPDGASVVVF